jgi:hypothetical protein
MKPKLLEKYFFPFLISLFTLTVLIMVVGKPVFNFAVAPVLNSLSKIIPVKKNLVEIGDKIPGSKLKINTTKSAEKVDLLLKSLNQTTKITLRSYSLGKFVTAEKLKIEFATSPQKFGKVTKGKTREVVRSFGDSFKNNTYTLFVYYAPSFFQTNSEETALAEINFALIQEIYILTNFRSIDDRLMTQAEQFAENFLRQNKNLLITEIEKQSFLFNLIFKPALAVCSGTTCGCGLTITVGCYCSDGSGASCAMNGLACGPGGGGTCTGCTRICDYKGEVACGTVDGSMCGNPCTNLPGADCIVPGGNDCRALPSNIPTPTPGGPVPTTGCTCSGCLYGCNPDCSCKSITPQCDGPKIWIRKYLGYGTSMAAPATNQIVTWQAGTHSSGTSPNPFYWEASGVGMPLPQCYTTDYITTVPSGYTVIWNVSGVPGEERSGTGNVITSLRADNSSPYYIDFHYIPPAMQCVLSPGSGFTAISSINGLSAYRINSGTIGTLGIAGYVNGALASSNLQAYRRAEGAAGPPFSWDTPLVTPAVFTPKLANGVSSFASSVDVSGLSPGDYRFVCNNVLPSDSGVRCTGNYNIVVRLNEASDATCDTVCSSIGSYTCINVGTDANGTSGRKWSTRCNDQPSNCTESMSNPRSGRVCSGHLGMWTNCRCETANWQDCGPNSRIVVRVVSPTPVIGQLQVSFRAKDNIASCLDPAVPITLPGNNARVNARSGWGTGDAACAVRDCNVTRDVPLNAIGTFDNLYVRATPGVQSLYNTRLVSLPATSGGNWIQCFPSGHSNQTSVFTYSLPAPLPGIRITPALPNPVIFGVTQNVGAWFQTAAGNVHGNTGSQTWQTPKLWSAVTNYFNIADILGVITREPGLVTASGTVDCADLTGGPDGSCHVATDWRGDDYSILDDPTANPVTWQQFFDLFPEKTPATSYSDLNSLLGAYPNGGVLDLGGNTLTVPNGGVAVPAGQKYIIFTSGNVDINGPITLGNGSFMAIFSGNTITVAQNVNAIAGVFLSAGVFSATGLSDTTLTVNGTVIAGSVVNSRKPNNVALTQTQPTVKFIFNPSLILNMPESLKHDASFSWKEISR